MVHVVILGGTGPTGLLVIKRFFQKYPDGTAVLYARNPSKFPESITSNPAITVVKGELTDVETLSSTFVGSAHVDAVLSVLGPIQGQPSHFAEFYETFIPIMARHNAKRLIALSTLSAEDSKDRWALLAYILVTLVSTFVGYVYRDVVAYADTIKKEASAHGIKWTIVRVPILTSKEGQKPVTGYIGDGKTGVILSRHAYAEFVVDAIESKEWVDKAPALSSVAK